jgi:hypothetical protein
MIINKFLNNVAELKIKKVFIKELSADYTWEIIQL